MNVEVRSSNSAVVTRLVWLAAGATGVFAVVLLFRPAYTTADYAERVSAMLAAPAMAYIGYVVSHVERHHPRWELASWIGIVILIGYSIFRVLTHP